MSIEPNQNNVAANRFIGRRLADNAKKPEVFLEDGQRRFTLNAFHDNRGTISVDAFWPDSQLTLQGQHEYRANMLSVCKVEGSPIFGWAFCKVGTLMEKTGGKGVSKVVHSPTPTNTNHADICRALYLQSEDSADPARSDKTWSFSVILKDFFNTYGEFVAA